MNHNVLLIIVSMIGSRKRREVLGFTLDECIKYKIVPCQLPEIDWCFGKLLRVFYSKHSNRFYERVTRQKDTRGDVILVTTVSVSYRPDAEEYQLVIEKEPDWLLRTYVIGRFERTTQQYYQVPGGNA